MNMQDNDMDELFRSKLANMEVEPSHRVWKGIILELDGAKAKRTILPVLRFAAAIAVVTAIGLYFLLKGEQPARQDSVAAVKPQLQLHTPAKTTGQQDGEQAITNSVQEHDKPEQPVVMVAQTMPHALKKDNRHPYQDTVAGQSQAAAPQEANTAQVEQKQAIQPQQQEVIANVAPEKIKQQQAVVPDVPLTRPDAAEETITKPNNPAVTAQVTGQSTARTRKKHGIRSLGDLINVVVAKVDKRPDKVIEFTDTDDDEATITGINLGLVKVKKEK